MQCRWGVFSVVGVLGFGHLASAAHIIRTPVKNGTSASDPGIVYQDGDTFEHYSGSSWLSPSEVDPNSLTNPPNPPLDLIPALWVIDGESGVVNDARRLSGEGWNSSRGYGDYKTTSNLRWGFRNRLDLLPEDMANAKIVHGGTPTCVNGTDENPLIFKYKMYLGPKQDNVYFHKLNMFAELTCGDDRAPTAVTRLNCYNTNGIPMTRYRLNMNGDGQEHRSIAIGQISWADQSPCFDPDPAVTNPTSKSYRLTMFDGRQWRHLYNWPASGVNIHTCGEWNRVTLTIKSTTIDVELKSMYNGNDCTGVLNAQGKPDFVTYTTTVPRQYLGPFTAVKMGGLHNEVDGGVWGQDKVAADHDGTVRAYPEQGTVIDDIDLYNGEAYDTPGACTGTGACCKSDYTCEQLTEVGCSGIEGATFQGLGTSCGVDEGRCCADPIVDGDHDGDVDMIDFAMFQRCLTVGVASPTVPWECVCFDTDQDGDVDDVDFGRFAGTLPTAGCISGPGIPANASCDDAF